MDKPEWVENLDEQGKLKFKVSIYSCYELVRKLVLWIRRKTKRG